MSATDFEPCELLAWDTEFFGFPIARVKDPLLTPERCERIDRQCRRNFVRCLYFRASADDPETTRLAQEHGFRLVDVRMTLDRKLDESFRPRTIASRIRRADAAADLPALEQIAAQSHRNTRFYYDGRFPLDRCEEMYRTWIRNAVREASGGGAGGDVVVAEADGRVAGYSASHPNERGSGWISLMAVAPAFRHRGIGDDLVCASLAWLKEHGATGARVTTQGWNVAAQRVYQRCGFRTSIVDLFYHKWFD
jgi:dTDP-4-amino-4,6-dideoxy-D-galactose acyltransferase